jgi:hypothetical protein
MLYAQKTMKIGAVGNEVHEIRASTSNVVLHHGALWTDVKLALSVEITNLVFLYKTTSDLVQRISKEYCTINLQSGSKTNST